MRVHVAVIGLVMALAAISRADRITNGGFEELDERYFPVHWSAVGNTVQVSPQAHSGQYSIRVRRERTVPMPPETGLNRGYMPGRGVQGAMLDQRKGIVQVWYQMLEAARDATVWLVVIPMGATGVEDTNAPRALRVLPHDSVGDGQWRSTRLPYDFSQSPDVRWVHVGVRIVGGPADVLFDDFELLPDHRPVLQIDRVHYYPDPAKPDSGGRLYATVANIGLAKSGPISVAVAAPPETVAEGPAELESLAPGDARALQWSIRGQHVAGAITLLAREADEEQSAILRLTPRVELVSVLASTSLPRPNATVRITARLCNRGTAAGDPIKLQLDLPRGVTLLQPASADGSLLVQPPLPGRCVETAYTVRVAGRPGDVRRLRCRLIESGRAAKAQSWPVLLTISDAPGARVSGSAGPMVWRTGTDRTIGELRSANGSASEPLGTLPHLGSVTILLPAGGRQTLIPRYTRVRTSATGAVLVGVQRDRSGGVWEFTTTIRKLTPSAVRISISVRCTATRSVLAFDGPTVLVGGGRNDPRRVEAVLPGLEWLVGDEVSSSDLDIVEDHPDRPRYSPHPNKVTVPAMSVATVRGVVALLWDPRQRWDGLADRPQPIFASPDRIEGARGHRLGLSAPSAAHGRPENDVIGSLNHTCRLTRGRKLTIEATLFASALPQGPNPSLTGLREWFRWYRADRPAPAPRGDDRAQIAWSMQAYTKSLWQSNGSGWLPFLYGPAIWRKASFDPSYAFDLHSAATLLPDHPDAPRWRSVLETARRHITPQTGDDLQFAEGDPGLALKGMAGGLIAAMAQEGADGSFRFDADRRDTGVFTGYDYHELGPPGAVESGTIANQAHLMLRAARLTGDRALYAAGIKSLRRLCQFEVPRAAQVWEVPVHSPDILASAIAVDACIEAYRYDRDRRWLAEARRWAITGLPFVYVWNAPGKLWMRYGSIPVFGATQMRGSWFGNVVQWNGLRYAWALLKLAEYDPSPAAPDLPWRHIAIGIARSAMHQQSTRPETLALWPDSLHTITDARAAWEFAPRQILQTAFAYLGRTEEPRTALVPLGKSQTVRISSIGRLSRVSHRSDRLTFRVEHSGGRRGTVMISGTTAPTSIVIGDRAAPRVETLDPERSGWRYDPMLKAVLIRIPTAAPTDVTIAGIRYAQSSLAPPVTPSCEFDFVVDEEGWVAEHDLGYLKAAEGVLSGVTTGDDPYLVRTNTRFTGQEADTLVLRIRASGSGSGQFYWTTDAVPFFDETRVFPFTFAPDNQWHEVTISAGAHRAWAGQTITGLRIDPANTPGVTFAIDRVYRR